MNRIQKGKAGLVALGIISLVLSIVFLILGIVMVVGSVSNIESLNVIKLVFGIIFIILFIPLLLVGIYFTWVGLALKATKGSIAEDNLGKGTVNMQLCNNCGSELNGDKYCPNCGKDVTGKLKCEKCGAENNDDNSHCRECGEALK